MSSLTRQGLSVTQAASLGPIFLFCKMGMMLGPLVLGSYRNNGLGGPVCIKNTAHIQRSSGYDGSDLHLFVDRGLNHFIPFWLYFSENII